MGSEKLTRGTPACDRQGRQGQSRGHIILKIGREGIDDDAFGELRSSD